MKNEDKIVSKPPANQTPSHNKYTTSISGASVRTD